MIRVGWIKLVLCDGELVEPSNYETLWHTHSELQGVYYKAGEILIITVLITCHPRNTAIFVYGKSTLCQILTHIWTLFWISTVLWKNINFFSHSLFTNFPWYLVLGKCYWHKTQGKSGPAAKHTQARKHCIANKTSMDWWKRTCSCQYLVISDTST